MGILSLIPVKDWLYGGIIVALLIAFGVYTHHERGIGRQQIEAADAKLAATVQKHNEYVQQSAADKAAAVEKQYETDLANRPATPAPRVVCVRPAAARGAVPQAAGNPGKPDAAAVNGGADSLDIGAPLVTVGKNADAQIRALQKLVQTLVDEMNGR